MALLAKHGEIQIPDAAIFADTGWEPRAVYQHLDWLEGVLPYPVHRVSKPGPSLRDVIGKGDFDPVPYHASGGGMGRRQCTREYKVAPIQNAIKAILGVDRAMLRKRDGHVVQTIGISVDEVTRVKDSPVGWIDLEYPLIDLNMTRIDCLAWLNKHGYSRPPKSACLGCPYHDNAYWERMRRESPDEWLDTVEVERKMRERRPDIFFHHSRVPLTEANLRADEVQLDMFSHECGGVCGV